MGTKDKEAVGPLSQASVASFVFGIIQITITGVYLTALLFIARTLTAVNLLNQGEMTNAPDPFADSTALILAGIGNIWGVLGFICGLKAIHSTNNGKSGDALGIVGIGLSLLAIVAFFVIPQLSLV